MSNFAARKRKGKGKRGSKQGKKKKKRQQRTSDFPAIIKDLEFALQQHHETANGVAGVSRPSDLKTYAGRWLQAKKKQGHPLIAGTPMCDQVHNLLGMPPPQRAPSPGLS